MDIRKKWTITHAVRFRKLSLETGEELVSEKFSFIKWQGYLYRYDMITGKERRKKSAEGVAG